MNIASFDIFDTTLIRKCGKPENIFWLLALRLFPDDKVKAFALYNSRLKVDRLLAESMPNYSILDIYKNREWSSYPEYSYEQLVSLEKQIEAEQLISNPEAVELINKCREDGDKIVFISDMYLDSEFLKSILKREGVWADGDNIYISNEHNLRKDTGGLYDKVRKELNPDGWRHYGDNIYSDIKVARRKGIWAKRIHTEFTKIEEKIIDCSLFCQDPQSVSLLVGASRIARLQFKNSPSAVLAADYLAPAYIPYIQSVISDAQQRNLKVLYFLSRDGFILKKIAEKLPHEGLKFRYLFVSRDSLFLPYLYQSNKDELLNVFHKRTLLGEKVFSILKRLSIGAEDLISANVSFPYSVIQNKDQECDFLKKIFSKDLYERWQNTAKEKYDVAIKYFVDEGLMEDVPIALVDVGWLGASRLMINKLRRKISNNCVPAFTYYWGIRKNVIAPEYGLFNVYMRNFSLTGMATSLIENYFSLCPYATTIGYVCNENGVCKPQLRDSIMHNEELISNNLIIVYTILDCIKEYEQNHCSLYAWASMSVNSILKMENSIDYLPLTTVDMNNTPFVKKLTLKEVLWILLGGSVTEMDPFSLEYTLGRKARKLIVNISRKSCDLKIFVRKLLNKSKYEK